VIKIRYADLPQGLHAQVRTGGRRPVIYLLPGLSPAQRRDALRRLIRTSRRGYGPRLRVSGVAFAVARDVSKSTVRTGLAAVRGHPAGSAVLAAFLAAAVVCYSLFVTVTVRLSPGPAGPPAAAGAARPGLRQAGGPGRSGGGASGPAGTQPAATGPHGTSPAGAAGSGSSGSAPSGSGPSGPVPSGPVPSGSGPSGPAAGPGPVPTGIWTGPGGVLPSVPAGAPGPTSSPSPLAAPPPASPGPRPPAQPGGLCLQLGPLGVCISG
jgi:hypothetical protein